MTLRCAPHLAPTRPISLHPDRHLAPLHFTHGFASARRANFPGTHSVERFQVADRSFDPIDFRPEVGDRLNQVHKQQSISGLKLWYIDPLIEYLRSDSPIGQDRALLVGIDCEGVFKTGRQSEAQRGRSGTATRCKEPGRTGTRPILGVTGSGESAWGAPPIWPSRNVLEDPLGCGAHQSQGATIPHGTIIGHSPPL